MRVRMITMPMRVAVVVMMMAMSMRMRVVMGTMMRVSVRVAMMSVIMVVPMRVRLSGGWHRVAHGISGSRNVRSCAARQSNSLGAAEYVIL